MMYYFILIAVAVFHGGYVSAIDYQKCDVNDQLCQKNFIKTLALVYGANGFKAYNISSIEPTYLPSASTTILGIYTLTLHEGECLNITKTCSFTYYELDTVNFRRKVGINCKNIVIQGRYTLETNPYFAIFSNITGQGNGSLVLEDWHFYFDNSFSFIEKKNDIYMKVNFNEGVFITNVNTRATFKADSIKYNNQDITNHSLLYINKYWKFVLKAFGGEMFRLSALDYYEVYEKLYDNMPATQMFTNDLKPYLNKN